MGNISIDDIKKLPKELVVQPDIYFDEDEEEKQKTISEAYTLAKQMILFTLDKYNHPVSVKFAVLLRLLGISNKTLEAIGNSTHTSKQYVATIEKKYLAYIKEATNN